ncbi:MAG: glycoside hydrolase family 16 protein, partial [Clostridia bacterium]|nr:glycoside hydrolase family 16 protein [Clostridia bacterium]
AMAPGFYGHLFQLFLEEFFGVPYDSGAKSEGCAVTPFYRELPALDEVWIRQQGYEKVFVDEFEGDSLNLDVWEHRATGGRRSGYNATSQVEVSDGKLTLTGEYLTDGEYGEGWYAGMIALKKWYRYGYFKAVIRCSECTGVNSDFWSAFWIQAPSPYDPAQSQGGIGPGGSEIDIMECWGGDFFSVTVWVSGYEGNDGLDSDSTNVLHTGNNYGEEYHSFELLWDEEYYRYYLDGQLTYISKFGYGTSSVEEQVILSIELPPQISIRQDTVRKMTVESVEIWQKPAAEE